jgi:hypothetical protein
MNRHHRPVLFELPLTPEQMRIVDRHEAELAVAEDLLQGSDAQTS